MLTVIETPTFVQEANAIWSDDTRLAFISWLSANPTAGDVIPKSGGCCKVRWSTEGAGKCGGARVIYLNRLTDGVIWLLMIYAKATTETIPPHLLKAIKEELENG